MTGTADPRPPRLDPLWLAFGLVPLLFVLGSSAPVKADGFLAVALACPAGLSGADCSPDTALDVAQQPASPTECPKVAQVLATSLSLPAGGFHKLVCTRRKG